MKKLTSLFLTAMIFVSIFSVFIPFTVLAAWSGVYEYEVTDGYATIIGTDGSPSGNVVIPDTLGGYPVTAIGDWVFFELGSITSVTIPEGVTAIGDFAFCDAVGLTNVIIPNSVKYVGRSAFSDTPWFNNLSSEFVIVGNNLLIKYNGSLDDVVIPDGVMTIGALVFEGKSLKTLTMPDSVITIGDGAVSACRYLETVNLSENLESVGNEAFATCPKLTSITFPKSLAFIGDSIFGGCTELQNVEFLGNLTSIGNRVFANCRNLEIVVLPSGLESIGDSAFSGCMSLETITLPDTLKSIGEYAFESCDGLEEIIIPNGVISVGEQLFLNCDNLTSVSIPGSLTGISDGMFKNCLKLANVKIAKGVTSIGNDAFSYCTALKGIVLPYGLTSIGDGAFINCADLRGITIPASVETIGDIAFAHCEYLSEVIFEGNAPVIGADIFFVAFGKVSYAGVYYYAGATGFSSAIGGKPPQMKTFPYKYTITNGNAEITGYNGPVPENLVIPDVVMSCPVTVIRVNAFYSCSTLKRVTIPESVTSIEAGAFAGCINLRCVIFNGNAPRSNGSALNSSMVLVCYYEEKTGFSDTFAGKPTSLLKYPYAYTITDGEVTLTGYFETSDTTLSIPSTIEGYPVTGIGEYAFYDCASLEDAIIPNSVTNIDNYIFYGCTSLTTVTFEGNAPIAGEYTFVGATNNFSVYYYEGMTGYSTMLGGKTTQMIPLPFSYTIENDEVTVTGYNQYLSSCLIIPPTINGYPVTAIGNSAFLFCGSLKEITIPNSVTSIGNFAFSNCENLKEITIPNSVTSIGNFVFNFCTKLKEITMSENITSMGRGVFINTSWLNNYVGDFVILGNILIAYKGTVGAVTIPDGIKIISDEVFRANKSLTSVVIPEGVVSIGNMTFSDCTSLTNAVIPEGVTAIGSNVFYGCTSLTNIIIPESVVVIGYGAFRGCTSLTSVVIPEGVTTIDGEAFRYCKILENITFKGEAPSVGYGIFLEIPNDLIVHYYDGATGFTNPWNGKTTVMLSKSTSLSVWNIKIQSNNTAQISVYNNTEEAVSGIVFAAVYSDNKLIEVKTFDKTFEANKSEKPTQTFDSAFTAGCYIKAFVWENEENLIPISNALEKNVP